MAKSCATLIIALFCFFNLSLASHAPPDNDEPSTQAALLNLNEPVSSEKQFNSVFVASATSTETPSRAVNRRFSVRSKLPCHRRHRKFRPTLIFPTGENSDFEVPLVYGGGRRVSGRWLRLHHHRRHQNHGEDRDSDDDDEEGRVKKTEFKRHAFDRFDKMKESKALTKMKKHIRLQNGKGVMKMKKVGFMRSPDQVLGPIFPESWTKLV